MVVGDMNISVICDCVLVINYMSLSGYFHIRLLFQKKWFHIMCGSQGYMSDHERTSCVQCNIAKGPHHIYKRIGLNLN